MKDNLLDLVGHTHDLGCIDLVKITGDDSSTKIEGLAEDKSVVVLGNFANTIADFSGTFGMPNLSNLKVILGIPEYKENATITVNREDRGEDKKTPVGLTFKNDTGDFSNKYRFMVSDVINDKLKSIGFNTPNWDVEFTPSAANIQRFKFQAQANPDQEHFQCKTEDGNLVLYFGDHSTHAGNFTFQEGIEGTLNKKWYWPIKTFISILNLSGDKTIRISDSGATQITVDSGLATYNYILPAHSK